jgi:long-chain acyl-CoA synthetase
MMTQATSILTAWAERVARDPDGIAVAYFDGFLTARELDRASDALASGFQRRYGLAPGERIGIYLQNVPTFVISLIAIWKAGAIAVPLNPMYRGDELRRLLQDSGTVGVISTNHSLPDVHEVAHGLAVRFTLAVDDREYQSRDDGRVLRPTHTAPSFGENHGIENVSDLIAEFDGEYADAPDAIDPDSPAFITYTSGTTGPPKGALNSHRNFLHAVSNFAEWVRLTPDDVVLAIAPLFHITGMTLNAGIALLVGAKLVLTYRFHPDVTVEAIHEHGVTFTIGSITAFNALLTVPQAGREHLASVRCLFSGGAPIPPSTISLFHDRFGVYLHNVWGMTETTGGGIAVPFGANAPIHGPSGTLSIGIPMQNASVRIIAPDGSELPHGEEGELEFAAPQVVPGYWQNPEATATTFPEGRLRTGDVAVQDEDGWIYLVDRLKDLINASGFKVWPREVEDTLYAHPAVYEAAVVGEPDPYRGETVVAYVSLKPGETAEPDELIQFTRERLAAYKYPRRVQIVETLPKTLTGKIRRSELRGSEGTPPTQG